MNDIIITVGSVTYAIKLRRLLLRGGVRSKLVKIDNSNRNLGCNHGVRIGADDFYRAVVIMRENRIPYSVYQGENNDLPR